MDIKTLVVGALVLAGPTTLAGRAAEVVTPVLTVRIYRNVLTASELSAAERLASRTLADAGVEVSWVHCWVTRPAQVAPIQCGQPPMSRDVILHVIHASTTPTGTTQALGFTLVDSRAGTATVATVYADRVQQLSRDAHVDLHVVLASAMAHEIGHVLMRSARHSPEGLMRAFWSTAELRRGTVRDWVFSFTDAVTMRANLRDDGDRAQELMVSASASAR